MSDLIYCSLFRFCEFACSLGESVLFEEEANFVAGFEEVGVAYVGVAVTGREFRHRVVGEGEVGEESVGSLEKGGACFRGEVVGDKEVAVFVKEGELEGC